MTHPIQRVLIANRSEVAARIQATAHARGIETICIYAPQDSSQPYLAHANLACPLSGSGGNAYLNYHEIIQIALNHGADAVHPGYGFFSENCQAAQAVQEAGLTWVGPSPKIIKNLGSKDQARKIALESGIPVAPGRSFHRSQKEAAFAYANSIGFPIIIKAALGGGGKGMSIAQTQDTFFSRWDEVDRTGTRLFNGTTIIIESYIPNPRHIEVQIAGDGNNHIHLFERNCSIQRRSQKVIEEAPAAFLSTTTKNKLYAAALALSKAVNYDSIGTVEFILDENEQFYFLEVNTRLQVEHTVTEMITGIDLVSLQFDLAEKAPLPLTQGDITIRGAAIECRIYAEKPLQNFQPSTGTLCIYHFEHHPFARIDTTLRSGDTVTPCFDPMVAKISTHGHTREHAIMHMKTVLRQGAIAGIETNLPLLLATLSDKTFRSGSYTISELTRILAANTSTDNAHNDEHIIASHALTLEKKRSRKKPQSWRTTKW